MSFSAVAPAAQRQKGAIASSSSFIQVLQYFHIAVTLKNYSDPPEKGG